VNNKQNREFQVLIARFLFIMLKKLISLNPFAIDALSIIRTFAGILILLHGKMVFDSQIMQSMSESLSKDMGLPFPLLMAYLAKGSEFFGGLFFALGLLTRFVSVPLAINMAVAAFVAHHGQITGEGEHAFLFLLIFVAFFFIGSGKWSLDYLLQR
jgi:putative oxidoreductase